MVTLQRKPVHLILFWVGAWAALAFPATARADFITPDSIPQPPPTVDTSGGNYRIDSSADLVTAQYTGHGLLFPSLPYSYPGQLTALTAAITNLNGVAVWSPVVSVINGLPAGDDPRPGLDYASSVNVQFVKPGGTEATAANSVIVEVLDPSDIGLKAFDPAGNFLGSTVTPVGTGPNGGALLSFSAPGISSFQVFHEETQIGVQTWGVAGIEFTPSPATAPEPCSLALAAFGATAFMGWALRRRRTRSIARTSD